MLMSFRYSTGLAQEILPGLENGHGSSQETNWEELSITKQSPSYFLWKRSAYLRDRTGSKSHVRIFKLLMIIFLIIFVTFQGPIATADVDARKETYFVLPVGWPGPKERTKITPGKCSQLISLINKSLLLVSTVPFRWCDSHIFHCIRCATLNSRCNRRPRWFCLQWRNPNFRYGGIFLETRNKSCNIHSATVHEIHPG